MFKDSEKIRAAIFDVDGTLLNSTPMWNKLTFAFAEKMGIAAPDDLFRTLNSLSLEQCAAYYHDVLHVEGTVEEIHEASSHSPARATPKKCPRSRRGGVFKSALRAPHSRSVATASDIASLRPAFDRLDMSPYISVIESCTTIGKSKEHPDIYFKCAADLKAAPHETVVFEDALYAAKTAKAAGFSVIGVLSEAVEEGDRIALQKLCDRCITDYTALLGDALRPKTDKNRQTDGSLLGTEQAHAAVSREALF